MLQPKKTKFRRQQKGRMKGEAQRGNQLSFGSFGIKSLESKWITGRHIVCPYCCNSLHATSGSGLGTYFPR